ncbi:DUF1840 domain-containing protein [Psychromonas antarctica]|uniref:DUF1840 domain-containing protein n=1 Tax=Psychromonas antarctica TaxID=67573 RepID=UPI001EE7D7D1|nr:DUF1840 domain-containing protein [Psychromonas antarctica]MCG6201803.1 DUF1840 domain-containing protein [Psychromonas antarctica]
MLVTFSSPAYANITMFGDVAVRLLKMMDHSGTVPSALNAENVQAALMRLEATIDQSPEQDASIKDKDDENDEPAISLSLRAQPLIELLRAAAKEKCHVMWNSNK